ncbi:MAG: Phenylalanine-tRNA ligase alpha subunit [Microgenomates group bacterium GW2011_GWA2_39_19]|nr:MAG: Phenylalanine-tRNA ligase alpha subunit [Microgenomates group bacterium GW2011_GWA2_39_19]HBL51622.1 phenylalanine--tRNA ligase subunit alpha [Candidatus Blackburnbacteria bacterium]
MEERIQNIKNEAMAQILGAESVAELEELRIKYLGRKGAINELVKEIPNLLPEKKGFMGRLVNEARSIIENTLSDKKVELESKKAKTTWFDPTIPGIKPPIGHLHILTQAKEEIAGIFEKIGFVHVRYPEVEWDWFAFESLNMPKQHPARDEWETFFVDSATNPKYGQMVLTPHTSSGQVREMERSKKPPIRMVNIAKCYRRQSDVSHTPMFHQFEGLVVDAGINIVNLKGTLDYFARQFFGAQRKTRLRPYHFQFTEPSFEVDISCGICNGAAHSTSSGQGCKLCKAGWLELGGAGMVHPTVLKNGGIDPKKYSGFAFGWGVERTYMMKSGLQIGDIRTLYSADLRFLKQF